MIYCNLQGGLANMLFQIAMTKSMAVDYGVNFSFPNLISHLEFLNNESNHNSSLKHSLEYLKLFNTLNAVNYSKPQNNDTMVLNYPFHYEKKILSNPNQDVLISGFFQSEKYFKHNRDEILGMLNFNDFETYVRNKYPFIKDYRCSAIHVRRGDYLKYPNHHPVQTIEYYRKGINLLEPITDKFIIFSDDIEWCKENLKLDNVIYIENEKDYIELYLMSLCNNNIISNSSFSWWGAWLNKNDDKVVIGPKMWFGSEIKENDNDIIPQNWYKL